MTKPTKLFIATKSIIVNSGKVLVIRESSEYEDASHAGAYDVVGGRLDLGEHFHEALRREVEEESGITDIKFNNPFFMDDIRPTVKSENWQIIRTFFESSTETTEVTLSQDHDHYKWIDPANYKEENVIENLWPVFEAYLNK